MLPALWRWLPLLLLFILALAACGEGEEVATPGITPTPVAIPSLTIEPLLTPGAPPTPTGAAGVTVDLATSEPLLTIYAADEGDLRNDVPALAIGDFNDDGIDDLLMGARFGDGPDEAREDAGEAYVIFGSPGLKGSVDIAQAQQHLTIFGAKPGDNLGYAVASADLNDDGIDDVIVSAPLSEGPEADFRTDRGEAYVIFGRAALGGSIDIAEGQQDFTIVGAEGFSLLGDSMATGDVNGDGIDDIILGAPFAGRVPGSPHGGPRTELGEIYVVFGSPTLKGSVSIPKGEQDFTIKGRERFGELGDAVACGDLNDDGIDDIIAVAEAADGPDGTRPNTGEAYVVFGSPTLSGTVDLAQGEQDLTVLGADHDDALGFSATSGDVNGDGIDDLILVAQRAGGIGNSRDGAGEAYVTFGSPDLGGTIDVARQEQNVIIVGADAHDLLSSCAAATDLDGDGMTDLLLGTSFTSGPANGRDRAGEFYLIYGSPTLPPTVDLGAGAQDLTIFGAEPDDRFGGSLAMGDLNGDGVQEIIVAAAYADGPDNARPDAGEVYAIVPPARR